jgi:spermidine synthase
VKRARTVYRGWSALSGRVSVIDGPRLRRLVVSGETLSMYPLDGDWTPVHHEYWWHALANVRLPLRPSVLMVGLGGGTQVHLLRQLARPRSLTLIERDQVILRVALDWFGLRDLSGLEFLCADAFVAVPALARAGRRFDFVMEDAAYGDDVDGAVELARSLAGLVTPRGTLVLNRHRRRDARRAREALAWRFDRVWARRVKREGENVLIYCAGPRG